jgi:hypothetical protein
MADFPRCTQCRKAVMHDAGLCKRAARNLSTNSRNERRYFSPKRCKHRDCPNPGYIVASSDLTNKRIRRHKMHDHHEREAFEAEVAEVAAHIYQDYLDYGSDPESFREFLTDCYSPAIADAVIAEITGAME